MQVKKQQLEPDREQLTGSKLGKEYDKAVYYYLVYLTSMQSVCASAKLLQFCPTLSNPMDGSPPGPSVHGIFQARILEWVAMPPPGVLPDAGIKPTSLMLPPRAGRFFITIHTTWDVYV